MSSPIGGNGGNGGFNLFDPLGLGGIVQGLVGGLAGEVGKLVNGPDNSCIAQVGQQLLNKVGSFDGAGAAGGSSQGLGQDPAATEFTPPKDPSVAQDGYQPAPAPSQLQQSDVPVTDPAPQEDPPVPGRGQSQSAATAAPGSPAAQQAQNEEELTALEGLMSYANAVDHYGVAGDANDGLFNRDSLTNVAKDPGLPKELRDAAQYLLDHPKMMQTLQIATGRGDGSISTAQLSMYASKLANPGTQTQGQTPSPTQGPTPQSVQQNSGGNVGIHSVQSQPPADQTQGASGLDPDQVISDASKKAGKYFGDSSLSMRDRFAQGGDALIGSLDKTISDLMKGGLDEMGMKKLQSLMEKRSEMFSMLSNIQKMFHDMSMAAIGNTR